MSPKRFLVAASLAPLVMASYLVPAPALAASQKECAIWLCLPGGFPSGCGGAKSAMKRRIKKGKSPLPKFSSCAMSDDQSASLMPSHMESREVVAARMRDGSLLEGTSCNIRNDSSGSYATPQGCVSTVKYVEVYGDNALMGNRYYLQGGSNEMMWQESPVSAQ